MTNERDAELLELVQTVLNNEHPDMVAAIITQWIGGLEDQVETLTASRFALETDTKCQAL